MKRIFAAVLCVFGITVCDINAQTETQRKACVVIDAEWTEFGAFGSGVVVGKDLVLTAAHCVRDSLDINTGKAGNRPNKLQIRTTDGVLDAGELQINAYADIAIVYCEGLPDDWPVCPIATSPAKGGDKLTLLTRGGMTVAKSHCHTRDCSAAPNATDELIVVADWVQGGNSGSPWLNANGEVVGVVSRAGMPKFSGASNVDGDPRDRGWPAYGGGLSPIRKLLEVTH